MEINKKDELSVLWISNTSLNINIYMTKTISPSTIRLQFLCTTLPHNEIYLPTKVLVDTSCNFPNQIQSVKLKKEQTPKLYNYGNDELLSSARVHFTRSFSLVLHSAFSISCRVDQSHLFYILLCLSDDHYFPGLKPFSRHTISPTFEV